MVVGHVASKKDGGGGGAGGGDVLAVVSFFNFQLIKVMK